MPKISHLSAFIAHARSKNMDHQTIRTLLLSTGWKEKDIADALATESLTMAIPVPPDAGSARDAFFHLLSFTALTTMIVSLIILYFEFLNQLFPDAAFPTYAYSQDALASSLRWPLSSVIVAFPLYLWMMRILQGEYRQHPEKLASGVRRWLTYITLFLTACTLLGDAITLVSTFLQGELTLRFLLKCFTIFLLTGIPFWYYLTTLRLGPDDYLGAPIHRLFLIISCVITGVAIVWSFILIGSPGLGRQFRLDEQRVMDLQIIQSEVLRVVYDSKPVPVGVIPAPQPLPTSLEDIAAGAIYQKVPMTDPETGTPYEYHVLSATEFELCATFTTTRDLTYDIMWNHGEGHMCFHRDVLKLR